MTQTHAGDIRPQWGAYNDDEYLEDGWGGGYSPEEEEEYEGGYDYPNYDDWDAEESEDPLPGRIRPRFLVGIVLSK